MGAETRVLYNETCPVCRFEIDAYRHRADAQGLPIRFGALDRAADWSLTSDQAVRQLHVWQNGDVLSGLDAFRARWSATPGWRWLARITAWPVIRPVTSLAYPRVAAPLLYRAHRRRQGR